MLLTARLALLLALKGCGCAQAVQCFRLIARITRIAFLSSIASLLTLSWHRVRSMPSSRLTSTCRSAAYYVCGFSSFNVNRSYTTSCSVMIHPKILSISKALKAIPANLKEIAVKAPEPEPTPPTTPLTDRRLSLSRRSSLTSRKTSNPLLSYFTVSTDIKLNDIGVILHFNSDAKPKRGT